jgi:hypothetical protein
MDEGSRRLAGALSAYLAALVFPITYLITTLFGCSWTTALFRACLASVAVLVLGRWLFLPLAAILLAGIAEQEAERKRQREKELE